MLNEKEIALDARLIAIEHLLAHVARASYLAGSFPDAIVRQSHENMRQSVRSETFQTANADPALKDHFAALIYETWIGCWEISNALWQSHGDNQSSNDSVWKGLHFLASSRPRFALRSATTCAWGFGGVLSERRSHSSGGAPSPSRCIAAQVRAAVS